MKITNKKISDASETEIRNFATQFLNLDIDSTARIEQVLAKIAQAQPGIETIFVNEEAEPEALQDPEYQPDPSDSGRIAGSLGKGDPRVTINIPKVDSADGLGGHDVGVGVNGVVWQLKRGFDLDIPLRVALALENAIQDVIEHDNSEGREGEVLVRTGPRIAFQWIPSRPSQEVIDEWRERTDKLFCP